MTLNAYILLWTGYLNTTSLEKKSMQVLIDNMKNLFMVIFHDNSTYDFSGGDSTKKMRMKVKW